jgi:hypothetical protein
LKPKRLFLRSACFRRNSAPVIPADNCAFEKGPATHGPKKSFVSVSRAQFMTRATAVPEEVRVFPLVVGDSAPPALLTETPGAEESWLSAMASFVLQPRTAKASVVAADLGSL